MNTKLMSSERTKHKNNKKPCSQKRPHFWLHVFQTKHFFVGNTQKNIWSPGPPYNVEHKYSFPPRETDSRARCWSTLYGGAGGRLEKIQHKIHDVVLSLTVGSNFDASGPRFFCLKKTDGFLFQTSTTLTTRSRWENEQFVICVYKPPTHMSKRYEKTMLPPHQNHDARKFSSAHF